MDATRKKLGNDFANKVPIPPSGYVIHKDPRIPGFGLRVTSNGAKSWILNYTINGRGRRYTIGNYPQDKFEWARNRAEELRVAIRDGTDPMEAKRAALSAPTLDDLGREYMERAERTKRPSSLRNDRGMLDKTILPRLGKLRVNSITHRDIEALHAKLKATPYLANRMLSLLSTMFNMAIADHLCESNPVKGIERYHEDRRETWLSIQQLKALTDALNDYPDQMAADAVRLLMVTGAREMEVVKATWDQFDLKRGVWTKPSHHVKQKRIEHVPLNRAALQILTRLHSRRNGSPFLFAGAKEGEPRATIRRPWEQALRAAGLAQPIQIMGKRLLRNKQTGKLEPRVLTRWKPIVRIHDLRHTFASHLVSSGQSLYVVGKLLGHTNAATTQRYAHLDDKSLRDSANALPSFLSGSRRRL
jgi:integrase